MPPESISLAELQEQFAGNVYQKDKNTLLNYINKRDELNAESLMGIYRNNTLGLLKENLELIYPTVLNIVGEDFFKALAYHYIPLNPSKSGDMHEYGENFGDFISHYHPAESMPYLHDVARLEWRWHQVYHAADDAAFDVSTLAQIAPENFDKLYFSLANGSALVQSDYPLLDIWQVSQPDNDSSTSVDMEGGAQNILLLRSNGQIQMYAVSDAEVLFIECLAEGKSFARSFEITMQDYEFDINASLQKIIQMGLITGCKLDQ